MLNENLVETMVDALLSMDLADSLKDPKEAQRYADEASATFTRLCEQIPDGELTRYEQEAYKRLAKDAHEPQTV